MGGRFTECNANFYEDRVRDSQYFKIHRLLFSKYGCSFDFRCRSSCVFDNLPRRRYSVGGCLSWRRGGATGGGRESIAAAQTPRQLLLIILGWGVLDLRCATVDVMQFEDTDLNMRCRDILLFGDVPITVYFGDQTCVSSGSSKIYIILSRYIDSF